jgi:Mn-dependent DtxR family transcriptional regulator
MMKDYDELIFNSIKSGQSMSDIGKLLGLTRARVSQIANRALRERGLINDECKTVREYLHRKRTEMVIDAIWFYWDNFGIPPTQSSLSEYLDMNRAYVSKILKELRDNGIVDYDDSKKRSIRLISKG